MLSHPGAHPCIIGFQQKKEEEKSSSSPSLDVTGPGGSCSANPVGMSLGGTVEGLQDSAPAVTCPTAYGGGAHGERQQLLEGSVSPFPFQGEKQELGRVGHILQAHRQLLKGG